MVPYQRVVLTSSSFVLTEIDVLKYRNVITCLFFVIGTERQRDQIHTWNEKELYPFLPTG